MPLYARNISSEGLADLLGTDGDMRNKAVSRTVRKHGQDLSQAGASCYSVYSVDIIGIIRKACFLIKVIIQSSGLLFYPKTFGVTYHGGILTQT